MDREGVSANEEGARGMKRVLIIAGAALVLFALIAQPAASAGWVKEILGALGNAAQAIITFVRQLASV
jgi:hypothetical protein